MSDSSNNEIELISFDNALSERYLAYALSTIMSRSLPDVRDGLKPVHRRLLYAMLQLRLDSKSAYKKCARVVGDVIGKYHPHGDTAVYDTLVRLAQNFSLRYPLIDGQGNFGSIDGDNPAAMRYTESRMTDICSLLMEDIDKDTVDFKLTYDDSDTEPALMPASFPNLLANGSEGIAVGMATSIPPHNLHELCDALMLLIDRPQVSIKELLDFVKGPDLPTGGIIIDHRSIIEQAYCTGQGSLKVRARWFREELSHGLYQIVITEIPYQIQKSKLIEQIADLLKDKKIPLIHNIRDESAENIRLIIEPRGRNCDAEMIMESLFKLTKLESRIQLNMNVLGANNIPRVMNLKEILEEFLLHRQNIITRKSKFLIAQINDKLEILAGLKITYLNLDEIIDIIRNQDEPKKELIARFELTDMQVEAILNLKLRSLKKLEEQQIIKEFEQLLKQKAALDEILSDSKNLLKAIKKELKNIQTKFGDSTELGKRRTDFNEVVSTAQDIDITAFVEKEPITILCSKMGWIRSIRGHHCDLSTIKYKEGDQEKFILECYTTDKIIICSSKGRFFNLLGDDVAKGKGYGDSIRLMIDIDNDDIVALFVYNPNQKILLASSSSKGFIIDSSELISSKKQGKQIMQVDPNSQCIACIILAQEDLVATIGENRKLLIFKISEIPEMKKGRGVILQRFDKAKLSDIKVFNFAQGLSWSYNNKIRIEKDISTWYSVRGNGGKIPPSGFSKDNKF